MVGFPEIRELGEEDTEVGEEGTVCHLRGLSGGERDWTWRWSGYVTSVLTDGYSMV